MSCSKFLPPFVYNSLDYLNRDRLERFSIVCRPLKNFIERYLHSKPYRVFDHLYIRGGSYALIHNEVQWHPNRDDYSVQQFLARQICSIEYSDDPEYDGVYYSFAEMHQYLGPTIRIQETNILEGSIFNSEHIAEMESVTYLWRDGVISISHINIFENVVSEDFKKILNSPTILQCRELEMSKPYFPSKDYAVLYTVKVLEINFAGEYIDSDHWLQFIEQPGVKPIVVMFVQYIRLYILDNALDRLKQAFSSAVSPNAFKIVFAKNDSPLTEFRETNNISGEKLELKKGLPVEYRKEYLQKYNNYTLERSSI